jgi:hypothetical protein
VIPPLFRPHYTLFSLPTVATVYPNKKEKKDHLEMSIRKDPLNDEQFTHSSQTLIDASPGSNGGVDDVERRAPSSPTTPITIEGGIRNRLKEKVDPNQSTLPLAAFSFMTGFMCVMIATPLFFRIC